MTDGGPGDHHLELIASRALLVGPLAEALKKQRSMADSDFTLLPACNEMLPRVRFQLRSLKAPGRQE